MLIAWLCRFIEIGIDCSFSINVVSTRVFQESLYPNPSILILLLSYHFISNIFEFMFSAGIDDCGDIDRDMLVGIYERVKANEFKPGSDHVTQVLKVQSTIVGKKPVSLARPKHSVPLNLCVW